MSVDEALVRRIVGELLRISGEETPPEFDRQVDPGGVIAIRTATVKTRPFQGREDVRVRDVVTLEEAPRMGCGIMELTGGASFPWTLSYDEYDIILEGTLEIETGGRVVRGGPGDVIYLPKGSSIRFQTPDHARYVYTVYPADWQ